MEASAIFQSTVPQTKKWVHCWVTLPCHHKLPSRDSGVCGAVTELNCHVMLVWLLNWNRFLCFCLAVRAVHKCNLCRCVLSVCLSVCHVPVLCENISDPQTLYKIGSYGMQIGTHMRSIKWCHFQWPWMTSDPKRRSRRYLTLNISEMVQDSCNGILTGTYTCLEAVILDDSDLAKYWVTRSTAQPVGESWASCI